MLCSYIKQIYPYLGR